MSEVLDPHDQRISASVRALAAGRNLTHAEVADAVAMARSTFERRLGHGGWSAAETARLAGYFGISVDSLLTGLGGLVVGDSAR